MKVISDNPKPLWRSLASPENLLCCSVQVCRQVSSPVSLWSSGLESLTWWSYWKRRWRSPHSCHCNSECADIFRILYAPGAGQNVRQRVTDRHVRIYSMKPETHSMKHILKIDWKGLTRQSWSGNFFLNSIK